MSRYNDGDINFNQVYRLADKARKSGFYQMAIDIHTHHLTQTNDPKSRYELFWLYRLSGQHDKAHSLVLASNDEYLWVNNFQKNCVSLTMFIDSHDWDQANKLYEANSSIFEKKNSIQKFEDSADCFFVVAKLHIQKKNINQAVEIYQQLYINNSSDIRYQHNLALAYVLAKRYEAARRILLPHCGSNENASSFDSCPEAHQHVIALSFGLQGDFDQARRWLKSKLSENQVNSQLAQYQKWIEQTKVAL